MTSLIAIPFRTQLVGRMHAIMLRWAKNVDVSAGSEGCWMWMGRVSQRGYGVCNGIDAHRAAWVFFRGWPQQGRDAVKTMSRTKLLVCHRCDVKLCVNPNHLFLGTARDNSRDMMNKGRDNFRGRKNLALSASTDANLPGLACQNCGAFTPNPISADRCPACGVTAGLRLAVTL